MGGREKKEEEDKIRGWREIKRENDEEREIHIEMETQTKEVAEQKIR